MRRRLLFLAALVTVGAIAFTAGLRVGYQWAYRNEHHLYAALLLDSNRTLVKENSEDFLKNQFYYTGLQCSKHYAQGSFHDFGPSASKAPKGKLFDTGSNKELHQAYITRNEPAR